MGRKLIAIRRALARLDGLPWEHLLALCLADHDANLRKEPHPKGTFERYSEMFRTVADEKPPLSPKDLKVDVRDVMRELRLQPGPNVGLVLEYIFKLTQDGDLRDDREEQLLMLDRIKRWPLEGPGGQLIGGFEL